MMAQLRLNDLSERVAIARTPKQAGEKPALLAFGWIVEGGVFKAGILICQEDTRVRTATFELYEPDDDNAPAYLGSVKVKTGENFMKCKEFQAYTGRELEVISETRA